LDTAFDELCGVDAFMTLNKIRREVLIEMVYNLGFSGVMKFKKMWAAIEVNDFEEAGIQMLDSKWHRQVGQRAKTLAALMGDGSE
jgi:lysozyme